MFSPLIISAIATLLGTTNGCQIFWNAHQSLGLDKGIQLQACCNITQVHIWTFDDTSKIEKQPIFSAEMSAAEDDPWSSFQLSKCDDFAELTIGYVEDQTGVHCDYRRVQTLTLLPTQLPTPAWYILCYETSSGCEDCQVRIFCGNELSQGCYDIGFAGSSPSATNQSLRYWVQIGQGMPFEHAQVEVKLKHYSGKDVLTSNTFDAAAGVKKDLELIDLKPNEIYLVERCLRFPISSPLMARFAFSSSTAEICSSGVYRTEHASLIHSNVPSVSLLFFFVLQLLC